MALPILGAVGLGLWCLLEPTAGVRGEPYAQAARARDRRALEITLALAAGGVLIPIVLALGGADYLAPRNLVAAMIPVTALLAVALATALRSDAGALFPAALALAIVIALAFFAISVDVDLSPRLQRGNWRALARELGPGSPERAITTVELGSAPLEYYRPGLRNPASGELGAPHRDRRDGLCAAACRGG